MSSRLRRENAVLYLDRNLGRRIVPEVLAKSCIVAEIHDDHLPQDAPDEAWISLCSGKGWIAVTKDNQLRYNSPIRLAITNSKVAIFTITAKNLTGEQLGQFIANNFDRLMRFCGHTKRPFLATISSHGHIVKVL